MSRFGSKASGRPSTEPYRLSISATLTFGFGILFLASLGTALLIALDAARDNTFELQRTLSEITVDAVVGEVDTHLGAAQDQAEFVGALIAAGKVDIADEARLADILMGTLAAAPQVSGIAFVRADYHVLRVGRLDGGIVTLTDDWSNQPGLRASMNMIATLQQPTWREVIWSHDFEAPHILVAEPVHRDGAFLGYVFSIVSISELSRFLDRFDRAHDTHSFILYGRDRVLAHRSLAGGFRGLSEERVLPLMEDIEDVVLAAIWGEVIDEMPYILGDSKLEGHVVRGPDDDYIYFYRELDHYGASPWLVGVYFRGDEVFGPIRRIIVAAVIGAGILVIGVVAVFLLGRAIGRPVRRLADAAVAVRDFDLARVKPLGGSRFRELDTAAKSFDAMIAGLRWFETYVPKSLVFRLMSQGGSSVRSEERRVTVLFTDIAGFTRIGARLDPKALADFLNDHFALLGEVIEAEEGTVDKYIGDSIMAFWGAPSDQPDHARRACRAAMEIARRVAEDNARRRARGDQAIGLRIGVHSGPAVVGNIGAPGRVNYTLVGDTVNTAQRLEALGKEVTAAAAAVDAGDVVVLLSGETAAALDEAFPLQALGRHELRGRGGSVEVYRLLAPPSAETG